MIVRSIAAYRHIKLLCRFFSHTRNAFMLTDSDTVAVTSGSLSGLTFAFERGLCQVSCMNWCTCFDLDNNFTAETLMSALVRHNVIGEEELIASPPAP